ncbi:MAG TPA: hypothetical protein VGF75_07455 [Candidatus Saccharimonadales bacterium]
MANKTISVVKQKGIGTSEFMRRIKQLGEDSVYVGIPAGSKTARKNSIRERAKKFTSSKKSSKKTKKHLGKVASNVTLSNAQALAIFTRGSVLTMQPPRPVIEPAIQAQGNKERIVAALAEANVAAAAGKHALAKKALAKAGKIARDAAKAWFFDSRNNWASNAAKTIEHKGFDQPGIDTESMRNAITYEERGP